MASEMGARAKPRIEGVDNVLSNAFRISQLLRISFTLDKIFWGGCFLTFHNKSPVASAVQENAVLLRSSGKVSPATKLHLTFHQRDAAWTITDFIFFFAF